VTGAVHVLQSPLSRDAAAAGIEIVHQELSVLDNLNVAENIFADANWCMPEFWSTRVNEKSGAVVLSVISACRWMFRRMQFPADKLSLGCRQLVELARSLCAPGEDSHSR